MTDRTMLRRVRDKAVGRRGGLLAGLAALTGAVLGRVTTQTATAANGDALQLAEKNSASVTTEIAATLASGSAAVFTVVNSGPGRPSCAVSVVGGPLVRDDEKPDGVLVAGHGLEAAGASHSTGGAVGLMATGGSSTILFAGNGADAACGTPRDDSAEAVGAAVFVGGASDGTTGEGTLGGIGLVAYGGGSVAGGQATASAIQAFPGEPWEKDGLSASGVLGLAGIPLTIYDADVTTPGHPAIHGVHQAGGDAGGDACGMLAVTESGDGDPLTIAAVHGEAEQGAGGFLYSVHAEGMVALGPSGGLSAWGGGSTADTAFSATSVGGDGISGESQAGDGLDARSSAGNAAWFESSGAGAPAIRAHNPNASGGALGALLGLAGPAPSVRAGPSATLTLGASSSRWSVGVPTEIVGEASPTLKITATQVGHALEARGGPSEDLLFDDGPGGTGIIATGGTASESNTALVSGNGTVAVGGSSDAGPGGPGVLLTGGTASNGPLGGQGISADGAYRETTSAMAAAITARHTLATPAGAEDGLFVNGDKTVAAPTSQGLVLLYVVEAALSVFEDIGKARLQNGRVRVDLDPLFAETVETDGYQVHLTACGDTRGVYIAARAARGFEIREQVGGASNVDVNYRIVALRKGFGPERHLATIVRPEPPPRAELRRPPPARLRGLPATRPDATGSRSAVPPRRGDGR